MDQVWEEVDTPGDVAICCTQTSPQRVVLHVLKKLVAQWLVSLSTFFLTLSLAVSYNENNFSPLFLGFLFL